MQYGNHLEDVGGYTFRISIPALLKVLRPVTTFLILLALNLEE